MNASKSLIGSLNGFNGSSGKKFATGQELFEAWKTRKQNQNKSDSLKLLAEAENNIEEVMYIVNKLVGVKSTRPESMRKQLKEPSQEQVLLKALNDNSTRQGFLRTFFGQHLKYETKEVNGYVLEQQITPIGKPIIAIFTKESWNKKQNYLSNRKK